MKYHKLVKIFRKPLSELKTNPSPKSLKVKAKIGNFKQGSDYDKIKWNIWQKLDKDYNMKLKNGTLHTLK